MRRAERFEWAAATLTRNDEGTGDEGWDDDTHPPLRDEAIGASIRKSAVAGELSRREGVMNERDILGDNQFHECDGGEAGKECEDHRQLESVIAGALEASPISRRQKMH